MSIPFSNGIPPSGPTSVAGFPGPAAIATLASPVGGQGASFSDVLAAGPITVAAGGNVLIQVFCSILATAATLDGLFVRIQNSTDSTIVQPKNATTNLQAINATQTSAPTPYSFQGVQTGLTPGASKTYKLQAASEGGVSGGTSIVDAVIIVWTW